MFDKLCAPSQIYLMISVIMLVLSYFGLSAISQQLNIHQSSSPLLQSLNFTYQKDSRTSYVVQGVFIILWTWVLSYLCRKGYTSLSWFLVLLPWVLMFLAFFIYVIETIKGIFFNTAGTILTQLASTATREPLGAYYWHQLCSQFLKTSHFQKMFCFEFCVIILTGLKQLFFVVIVPPRSICQHLCAVF